MATANTVRYVVLKPNNFEDGRGPMKRVREFRLKRDARNWVRQQTGLLGGKPGSGWEIMREMVDERGFYVRS